jgi:hypothetical protein
MEPPATPDLTILRGGCHCGNLAVALHSPSPPEELPVRACQCSFCTRHGVHATSHPEGRVEIQIREPAELSRYRFGLGTAEFLICRRCGVYVAALMTDADGYYATLNVLALAERERFTQPVTAVSYDAEDAATRVARRKARWTPARVTLG